MGYDTKHLDFDGSSLNEDDNLVIGEFGTINNADSEILKSGRAVDVTAEVVDTKIYTEEYIDSALASCTENSPRFQEWTDIKTHFDLLQG